MPTAHSRAQALYQGKPPSNFPMGFMAVLLFCVTMVIWGVALFVTSVNPARKVLKHFYGGANASRTKRTALLLNTLVSALHGKEGKPFGLPSSLTSPALVENKQSPIASLEEFQQTPEMRIVEIIMKKLAANGTKANLTKDDRVILDTYGRSFAKHWATMIVLEDRAQKDQKLMPLPKGHQDQGSFPFWPRVFVMGAPKTSSTHTWRLVTGASNLCPACCTAGPRTALYKCGVTPCKELFPAHKIVKTYLKHFGIHPKCHALALSEAAPMPSKYSYVDGTPMLTNWGAPEKLKKLLPPKLADEIKFVVPVREPVARALSAFNHKHSNLTLYKQLHIGTFEEMMHEQMLKPRWAGDVEDFVGSGMYAHHLDQWFKTFSRKQFLLVEYSSLVKEDSLREIDRIATFLGVDPSGIVEVYEKDKAKKRNLKKRFEMGDVPCDIMRNFSAHFARPNDDLYNLLDSTSDEAPPGQQLFRFSDPMSLCGGAGARGWDVNATDNFNAKA